MPYVEGFGTYPFGEEWLFDAVIRSYLPVLEVARDLTMTVTPVLADQLEDAGVARAAAALPARVADRRRRSRPATRCRRSAARPARRSCDRYRHALELLDAAGGDPLRALPARRPTRDGSRSPPRPPPTRCCRCWRPAPGLRLQLDAGLRSHRRRFGWDGGFWLPECAYAPGLEWRLAEHGVELVLRRPERPRASRWRRWRRSRPRPGRSRCRSTGRRSAGSGRSTATPPTPPTPSSPANRCAGCGSGRSAAAPTTRPRPRRRRGARPSEFLAAAAARLRDLRRRAAAAAACSSSRSTPSCSATGGRRARSGSRTVLDGRRAPPGSGCVTVPQALAEHEPVERPLRASTWGEGKDLRTWDSPAVADLAWGARRAGAAAAAGRSPAASAATPRSAPRASCSPLQSSDWAFLDQREPGRRLRLPAGDRPLTGAAGGHRLRPRHPTRVCAPSPRTSALAPLLEP